MFPRGRRFGAALLFAASLCALPGAASAAFPVELGAPAVGSPRFVDLDADSDDELVAATKDGHLFAFDAAGAQIEGSPADLSAIAGHAVTLSAPPAFGDLNGSGTPEVLISTDQGDLIALGAKLAKVFVKPLGAEPLGAPVVTVTATSSGTVVVVLSTAGTLHVQDAAGEPLPGSPFALPAGTYSGAIAVLDVDHSGFPSVLAAGVGADGHARAFRVSLTNLAPGLSSGWPVDLGAAADVLPPVIADFDGNGDQELVFRAKGQLPVVLRASGDPAIALSDVPVQSTTNVWMAAADLDGDDERELLCAIDGGLAAFAVGHQLRRNAMLSPQPAQVRAGFPVAATLAPLSGIAVADLTGETTKDVAYGDGTAVNVVSKDGVQMLDWPRDVGEPIAGAPAVGVQRDQLVVSAVTASGKLFLWTAFGQPRDIAWDGFQHDPGNTGALSTPLPARTVHAIGGGAPGPAPGCCQGSIGGYELSALSALVTLARAVRPRRRRPN